MKTKCPHCGEDLEVLVLADKQLIFCPECNRMVKNAKPE